VLASLLHRLSVTARVIDLSIFAYFYNILATKIPSLKSAAEAQIYEITSTRKPSGQHFAITIRRPMAPR
jgi:hypothetical protein